MGVVYQVWKMHSIAFWFLSCSSPGRNLLSPSPFCQDSPAGALLLSPRSLWAQWSCTLRAGITSVPSHTTGTCTGCIVQEKGASLPPTQSAFDWNHPNELTSSPVLILAQDHLQRSFTGLPRCCRVLQLCAKAFPCPSPTQALPQQCHLSLAPEATGNFCVHLSDPPWWFV